LFQKGSNAQQRAYLTKEP